MADPRPAAIHQQQSGGLFGNADHTVIYGGNFTSVGTGTKGKKSGFQILQEHVAAPAFHNSKQRLDPPRCHENTRQAVLQELFEWITGNAVRTAWVAWLNGAAGAGKSAICQSMAEMCITHGILVASFFFFRTDATRNTVDPLVPTIAYQIIQLLPQTKDIITRAIESNPLIFEQSLEKQFAVLIMEPLRHLRTSESNWHLLVIIDGLDECSRDDTQMNIVRTIARLLREQDPPVIILFGSRRENHILMAFNSKEMNGMLTQLPLDNNYHPDEDIRLFLNDSFDNIKRTHPFSTRLSPDWPSVEHVQEIIDKSSGQFIYASVVINFLSIATSNPSTQLDIVRGLRPTGRATPFAQLDALYGHIFSQVTDLPTVLDLLAYRIFGRATLSGTSYIFRLSEDDVQSMLAPLVSVLWCNVDGNDITFRHASLPDFLRDKARSREFCISSFPTRLCIFWLERVASGLFKDLEQSQQNSDVLDLLPHCEATPELFASLATYRPTQHHSAFSWNFYPKDFLTLLQKMDFGDGGKFYEETFNTFVRYVKREFPDMLHYMTLEHDISKVLEEIEVEQAQLQPKRPRTSLQLVQHHSENTEKIASSLTRPLTPDITDIVRSARSLNVNDSNTGIVKAPSRSLQVRSNSDVSQPQKLSKRARLKAWLKRGV